MSAVVCYTRQLLPEPEWHVFGTKQKTALPAAADGRPPVPAIYHSGRLALIPRGRAGRGGGGRAGGSHAHSCAPFHMTLYIPHTPLLLHHQCCYLLLLLPRTKSRHDSQAVDNLANKLITTIQANCICELCTPAIALPLPSDRVQQPRHTTPASC